MTFWCLIQQQTVSPALRIFILAAVNPFFWLNLMDPNSSVRKPQKACFVPLAFCPLLKPVTSNPCNYCLLLLSWIVTGPRVCYQSSSISYAKISFWLCTPAGCPPLVTEELKVKLVIKYL